MKNQNIYNNYKFIYNLIDLRKLKKYIQKIVFL